MSNVVEQIARQYVVERTEKLEQQFIIEIEPYVLGIVRKLARRCDEDMGQTGRVAAILALRTYNPTRSSVLSWVYKYVKRDIYRSRKSLIHIPEYIQLLIPTVVAYEQLTDGEIATIANTSLQRVKATRWALNIRIISTEEIGWITKK